MPSFEVALNNIRARRWSALRSLWLGYVPRIDPPGSAFPGGIGGLPGLQSALEPLADDAVVIGIEGVRGVVLREGMFFLHKTAHLMAAAELQVMEGLCSSSLATAYQAAVFGARAILCLLGIGVLEFREKPILIDVWSVGLSRKVTSRKRQEEEFVTIATRPGNVKLGQRHIWRLFQRILRVSTVEVWPADWVTLLRHLDEAQFARQRNRLQYRSDAWILDDLHNSVCYLDFGTISTPGGDDGGIVADSRSDFTLVLAVLLLTMSIYLVTDLARETRRLDPELELLARRFLLRCHPLMARNRALLTANTSRDDWLAVHS